jgi:hypothetical protein
MRHAQCQTGAGGATSPYSPVGPTALARLGVDVLAPLRSLRPTWDRLLPEASAAGYFAALRVAIERGEVVAGDGRDQLRWLAEHLHIPSPWEPQSFPYINAAWSEAANEVGASPARELGVRGKQALFDALLHLPAYPSRLADALAEAFRAELNL